MRRGALLVLSLLLTPLLALGLAAPASAATAAQPLERAHAHNDYEHTKPLYDALSHGFTSVEVDVYLVGNELLVAHDPTELEPGRTIQSLYLDPLRTRVRNHGGRVYPGYRGVFQLLIDIKSEPVSTYTRLHEVLAGYRNMMTVFTPTTSNDGAVTAVVSGNRPMDLMARQAVRYAGYDGRLADLTSGADADFMPLISDNWERNFTWRGVGPMPAEERARLRAIVAQVHRDERRIRFWATPDLKGDARRRVWTELLRADVDHINTDDLSGLRYFLRTYDPQEARTAA